MIIIRGIFSKFWLCFQLIVYHFNYLCFAYSWFACDFLHERHYFFPIMALLCFELVEIKCMQMSGLAMYLSDKTITLHCALKQYVVPVSLVRKIKIRENFDGKNYVAYISRKRRYQWLPEILVFQISPTSLQTLEMYATIKGIPLIKPE